MKKLFIILALILIVIFIFTNSCNVLAQQPALLAGSDYIFGLYSNLAYYSYDETIFSFSYLFYENSFNQISLNLGNFFLFSYTIFNKQDNPIIFVGIPLFFKLNNLPISFGFLLSNIYLSISYYIKLFRYFDSGFSILYPLNNNFYSLKNYNYQFEIGINLFKKIRFSTYFYFSNSVFYQNINIEELFFNYVNLEIDLFVDLYDSSFSISYSSEKIWKLIFSFYNKFNSFHLIFSLDEKSDSYSFGFSISKEKNVHDSHSNVNLYIVDFNEIKPDANLYLSLREKSKIKGNIFLFITGKNLKKIVDIEDLTDLIKELKKNNLCFIYIEKSDLINISFATNFHFAFLDKLDYFNISSQGLQNNLVDEIVNQFNLFFTLTSLNEITREKISNIIKDSIIKEESFKDYFNQVLFYLIKIISLNKNLNESEILNLSIQNKIMDNDIALKLKLIDFIIDKDDIIKKIKEISEKEKIKIKKTEKLFIEYNKLNINKFYKSQNVAIVYLKGIILSEKNYKSSKTSSEMNFEILTFQKVEKILNKIKKENYLSVVLIIDSPGGELSEGIKILSLLKEFSLKIPVFILQNSIISSGSLISSLMSKNLYTHQNTLIIPYFFDQFFSLPQIVDAFANENSLNYEDTILMLFTLSENSELKKLFEDLLKKNKEYIKFYIEKQRNILLKILKILDEKSFLSGYDSVGINLSDFIIDFNNLINLIIKQSGFSEDEIKFDIIYSDNFKEKKTFFEFLSEIFNEILNYFSY